VGYHNQLKKVALISHDDLTSMRGVNIALWEEICGVDATIKGDNLTFTVVKVVSQRAEYKFSHLSFQEFFFIEYARTQGIKLDLMRLLLDDKFDNTLRLAFSSPEVTAWLLDGISSLNLQQVDLRVLLLVVELLFGARDCMSFGNLRLHLLLVTDGDQFVAALDKKFATLSSSASTTPKVFNVVVGHGVICVERPTARVLDLFNTNFPDSGESNATYTYIH